MRYRLVCLLILSLSIWLTGSAMADYVDSVVLLPDFDGYAEGMTPSVGEDDFAVIDDSSDSVCAYSDTVDYLWGSNVTQMHGHTTAPDTSNKLDSMAMNIEVAELKSGTSGDFRIIVGWRYKTEGEWYYCTDSYDDHHALDTIEVDGLTCTSFRHSQTKNPCWGDELGLSWTYFAHIYDDHNDALAWQWVTDIIEVESGCIPNCTWRIYNWWWVGYFMVEEAEGQVIPIIDASDFHRPLRAYLDWRKQ